MSLTHSNCLVLALGVSGTYYDSLGFLYCTPPGELSGDQENLEAGKAQTPTSALGSGKSRFAAAGDHAMQQFAMSVKYQESGPWLDLPYTLQRKGTFKNCWICEAWQETRIHVSITRDEHPEIYAHVKKAGSALNIHLSCDFWRPQVRASLDSTMRPLLRLLRSSLLLRFVDVLCRRCSVRRRKRVVGGEVDRSHLPQKPRILQ